MLKLICLRLLIDMENKLKTYFNINASKYVKGKNFDIVRPASLNNPKNNSVMFIMASRIDKADVFEKVEHCLIFWPTNIEIPESVLVKHAVFKCEEPHSEYCRFYRDNNITYLPQKEDFEIINGAYICKSAVIGQNVIIMPGVYIGGDVSIGNNVYVGAGTKLVGEIIIGNNVVIRENSVIGADGLSTDREKDGKAITMPQFGRVILEDNVQIGANTVIARGAIDDTRICKGAKIDNACFISHNTVVGEDTFIVGETIMFGSSSVGKRCLISGNSVLANFVNIGDDCVLGMGSVALKSIPNEKIAFGSPVKTIKDRL